VAGLKREVVYSSGPESVTVQVKDDADAAALLEALIKAKVRVKAFGPVGSALEQVYLSMDQERR
jgi:ABC-2 type transport system ATP-binding protein